MTRRARARSKPRILIVDDEDVARHSLAMLLRLEGFHVVEARDGIEGIMKARRESPDAVLMDIAMPIMDGFQAAEIIRQTSDVPVIACTAAVRSDLEFQDVFASVIEKPFSAEQVIQQLSSVMSGTG